MITLTIYIYMNEWREVIYSFTKMPWRLGNEKDSGGRARQGFTIGAVSHAASDDHSEQGVVNRSRETFATTSLICL